VGRKTRAIAKTPTLPLRDRARGWLPSLITGVLVWLAFPTPSIFPLAFLAYVPLLVQLRGIVRWQGRFFAGWRAGTLLHLLVYPWIGFTMRSMSGIDYPLSTLILLAYALGMGLFQGLFATFAEPVRRLSGKVAPLALGTLYACGEAAFPFLFPWHLGNALFQAPVLLGVTDLAGIHGLSLVVMLVNALLAEAWVLRRSGGLAAAMRPLVLVVLAVVALIGYGLVRLRMVDDTPVEKALRVAVVQGYGTIEEKRSEVARERIPMLDRHVARTEALDPTRYDLLVWPEGAFPFYFVPEVITSGSKPPKHVRDTLIEAGKRALAIAPAIGKDFVMGTLRRTDAAWKERARNSVYLLRPDGTWQIYDKQLLVAFGEYMPLTSYLPWLAESIPGVSDMAPGDAPALFETNGVRVLPSLCYEAIFTGFTRDAAAQGAEVILNLTNDVWFGDGAAPELHLMVQVPRTTELRLPLVRATNSGITAFVDAGGRITERGGIWREETIVSTAEVKTIWSGYRLWGDAPLHVCVAVCAVILAIGWRRARAGFDDRAPVVG